jgi:pyruvate/2-oxoglutarate dehydrogenase complex dihydrolipoamide acyltransferase (E2) component
MSTPTPTPTIYKSRSRTTRTRVLVGVAVVALVLVGFLIGRLDSGPSAKAAPAVSASSAPPVASPSAAPPASAPAAPAGTDAYAPIQAENASAQQGTQTQDTSDAGGGQNVGWVANGDWLQFTDVNFGTTPPKQLVARLSSAVNNNASRMDIRIDDIQSAPIGTLPILNTGGWDAWRTQATDVSAVTGVHTVFLTFASDAGDDFLNLNYFSFSR